jgi:hypothetical protein
LQISQVVVLVVVGDGGAEWLRSVVLVGWVGSVEDGGIESDAVVEGAGVEAPEDLGITIERYLFAILSPVPDGVLGAEEVRVESSWSEERTNGTRFLEIPAPKTRWSSSGRK